MSAPSFDKLTSFRENVPLMAEAATLTEKDVEVSTLAQRVISQTEESSASGEVDAEVQAEDIKWLYDRDRRLLAEKTVELNQAFISGEFCYVACMREFPGLPPVGTARYSREKRRELLQKLTQLPAALGEVPGGCSLGINLFEDYFHYLSKELLRELHRAKIKPLGGRPWSQDFDYNVFVISFKVTMGALTGILDKGCMWSFPATAYANMDIAPEQDNVLSSFRIMRKYPFFAYLEGCNLKSCRQMVELINLFEDVVAQEIEFFAAPLSSNIDHSRHFERLKWRVEQLQETTSTLEQAFDCVGNDFFKTFLSENELFQGGKADVLAFCNFIKEATPSSLDTTKINELHRFFVASCYRGLYDDKIKKLNLRLDSNIEAYEGKGRSLMYLTRFLVNQRASIIDEGVLFTLDLLLKGAPSSHTEVDSCLSDIIKALGEIRSYPLKPIRQKIEALGLLELSADERDYWKVLERIWSLSLFFASTQMSQAQGDMLTYRLERCKDPSSTHFERALALRDAELLFGCVFAKFIEGVVDSTVRCRRSFFNKPGYRPELLELSNAVLDLVQAYQETIRGARARIDAVVDKCAEETASALSRVNSVPRAVRKSKATAKKSKTRGQKIPVKPPAPMHDASVPLQAPLMQMSEVEVVAQTDTAIPLDVTSVVGKKRRRKKKGASGAQGSHAKVPSQSESDGWALNIDHSCFVTVRKSLAVVRNKQVAGADAEFRRTLIKATARNLKHVVRQLEETTSNQIFGLNSIFGETDALRRLMEASLQLALADSPVVDKNGLSVLRQIPDIGHELHKYVRLIINCQSCAANVRQVVLKHRMVPYQMSQANACVNYHHTTKAKGNLTTQAELLITFLSRVEAEISSGNPDPAMQEKLLQIHHKHVLQAVSFVSELLVAIADPGYAPERAGEFDALSLEGELNTLFPESNSPRGFESPEVEPEEAGMATQTVVDNSDDATMRVIRTRGEAVEAIGNALIWLRIRSLPPVEGKLRVDERKLERNLAFDNVRLYLNWLREKLSGEDFSPLYDTCFEEMKLMRRAHKELSVGFLLHGDYFKNQQHIVDAERLRYVNNPCAINRVLLRHSPHASKLPNLNESKYKWMSAANQWLSYPMPQWSMPMDSPWVKQVRAVAKTVKELSRLKRKANTLDDGFTLIEGGTEVSAVGVKSQVKEFVQTQERQNIFTSLSALLHTIKHGMATS